MEKLAARHGPALTERALRFVCIRLKPHADSASLRARLQKHRTTIHELREAFAEAVEERIAGTVEIEYRDGRIDRAVIELAADLRPIQKTEEGAAAYKAGFPSTPSAAVKGVVDDTQTRFVENLAQQLENHPGLAVFKDRAAPLRQLVADADAAVATRENLYVAEGQARTSLQIAVGRAQRDYNLAFAELTLAFPDDAALAESMFWAAARSEPVAETTTTSTPTNG